ncbi:MAG TPA: glycosyltransferase [Niabella sp.]|nr:glycosyltransferase [Niabella sp.]HOZ96318.1 glycosyltransferase [Niabella sp.]HQW14606.1 glycosyltransferase [Niabella sp.]HQX19747.1 glycosyltransferase [Niabella sp.]HRB08435.1 glycosyltransferase [Niabella sp.]
MKILQINKYHYVRGGSDSVYFNTGKLLEKHGHQVIHFAMNFNENEASSESYYFARNMDFVKLSLKQKIENAPSFFYNKDAAKKIRALVRKEKPDIAHLHIFYGSLTSSILKVLNDERIPAVVSVHDYKFVCPSYLLLDGKNNICEVCKGKHFFKAIQKKCVKDSYLFSSMFAMEAYYRDYFFPIHKMFRKLIFVSNFSKQLHNRLKPELNSISTHLYNFDPALSEREPNNIKGDYFLYAGRLSKEKGLNTLISAFQESPNIELKIAGSGDLIDDLKTTAPPNISFLGFQKPEQLRRLILEASFVIVPSEWYENNPMAIIESYGLGKPVIAANIGGIPEIVSENKTGYLFESGDIDTLRQAITTAHNLSNDEYVAMSRASIEFSHNHFEPEIHYEKLMEIYRSVLP